MQLQIHSIGVHDLNGKGSSNWLWSTLESSFHSFLNGQSNIVHVLVV